MSVYYLDTPAASRLFIEEKEFEPLAIQLTSYTTDGGSLCSSLLLHAELHCAVRRHSELDQETVTSLLSGINFIDISRSQLVDAARTPLGLGTVDTIHLTVVLGTQVDATTAYDIEMQDAARLCNLSSAVPS